VKTPTVLPPHKFLKECFRYERSTGKVFWKKRPAKHFSSACEHKRWNTRYAGVEAFLQETKDGHLRGGLEKVQYLAHRIIWKMVTGKEPPDIIDHKDRDEKNNRWKNLRSATTVKNCINNDSDGVSVQRGRWRARITTGSQRVHVGYFASREEAVKARKQKNRALNGAFAP
jgi:hypothetical protein